MQHRQLHPQPPWETLVRSKAQSCMLHRTVPLDRALRPLSGDHKVARWQGVGPNTSLAPLVPPYIPHTCKVRMSWSDSVSIVTVSLGTLPPASALSGVTVMSSPSGTAAGHVINAMQSFATLPGLVTARASTSGDLRSQAQLGCNSMPYACRTCIAHVSAVWSGLWQTLQTRPGSARYDTNQTTQQTRVQCTSYMHMAYCCNPLR